MTRDEWLLMRKTGIGASEAAAVVGMSPYCTNEQLWEIKTGRRQEVDIGDKPYVQYGLQAEPYLRALFALNHPQYMVEHEEYEIIRNPEYQFIFCTPDGKLLEMDDSEPMRMIRRRGILEIKTTEIMNPSHWDRWNKQIPDNYYIQVLHQMLATGWPFAVLNAQIKWRKDGELQITTRHYTIERSECEDDLRYLLQEEIRFWDYVKNDRRPHLSLPAI